MALLCASCHYTVDKANRIWIQSERVLYSSLFLSSFLCSSLQFESISSFLRASTRLPFFDSCVFLLAVWRLFQTDAHEVVYKVSATLLGRSIHLVPASRQPITVTLHSRGLIGEASLTRAIIFIYVITTRWPWACFQKSRDYNQCQNNALRLWRVLTCAEVLIRHKHY